MYKTVWAPFIGEELPLKAEVFRHNDSTYVSTCGSWPRPRHYTTRRLFETRRILPFFGSSPRRLNEAGVYLMTAFIRGNMVLFINAQSRSLWRNNIVSYPDLASSPGHTHFSMLHAFSACNIEKWVWPGDETRLPRPSYEKIVGGSGHETRRNIEFG